MNNNRRGRLKRAHELLKSAAAIVEHVKDEEQDSFDNLPESFQDSDNGQRMEEAVSHLEDALSAIEEAGECIELAGE